MKKIISSAALVLIVMLSPSFLSAKQFQLKEPAVFITKKTGVVKLIKPMKKDKESSIVTVIFLNEEQMGVALPNTITDTLKIGSIIQLFIQENKVYSINVLKTKKTEISKEFLESVR